MPIDKASARRLLKPRREPYWHRVAAGRFLGFRVLEQGVGTWVARWRTPDGAQRYHALGEHPDFDSAAAVARTWFDQCEGSGEPDVLTVREACERHVKALRAAGETKNADQTAARFGRLVYPTRLARVPLHRLRATHIEDWRNELAQTPARVTRSKDAEQVYRPRSASTVNRDMVPLRAALNRAHGDGLVVSDAAWRAKLEPIKNAGRRRDVYMSTAERRDLIEKAEEGIRPFLRALAALPLRPGAVAALTVGDLDRRLGTLRIGTDKAGQDRRIKLPPATAELFAQAARGKTLAAPLFGRPDGRAWDKDAWWEPVRAAAKAAGLAPNVSAYALRHSTITDLVVDGLDLLTVAQISGTSVAMIQEHYGHLQQDRAAAALAKLAV